MRFIAEKQLAIAICRLATPHFHLTGFLSWTVCPIRRRRGLVFQMIRPSSRRRRVGGANALHPGRRSLLVRAL